VRRKTERERGLKTVRVKSAVVEGERDTKGRREGRK